MVKYSIYDFQSIQDNGFVVDLPTKTIELISTLSQHVGSPTYIKTPVFNKKDSNYNENKRKKGRFRHNDTTNNNSQDNQSNIIFKLNTNTVKKEGIDLQVQNMRSIINKIGKGNNEELYNDLFNVINEIIGSDISKEDSDRSIRLLVDILSHTKFYTKIYTELFSILLEKYKILKDAFSGKMTDYMISYESIVEMNPDKDYDLFCKTNKENDIRKSISTFYLNLYLKNKVNKIDFYKNLKIISTKLFDDISKECNKYSNDEIIENICIFMSEDVVVEECKNVIISDDISIHHFLNNMATGRSEKPSGLSTKALFKLMDTLKIK
jgi:hypothetical protein